MAAPARTAFVGTPSAAVPSLAALAAITEVELVITRPDKPRGRSGKPKPSAVKEAAEAWGLPIAQPNRAREAVDLLRGLDLAVVVAYGQILPADVLAAPTLGFVNVHFSRLPRWRGAAPVARAILAGDPATGVDIIQLDEGMDTGPLISRREAPIAPTDTTGTLTARLAGIGAELLTETLPAILDGTAPRTPQEETGVTIAGKLTSDEGRLDPRSMTAEEIGRVVRAFNPNPGAWGTVDGQRLKVWETRVRPDLAVPPGQTELVAGVPVVGAAGGTVELLEIQAAGKSRLPGSVWARVPGSLSLGLNRPPRAEAAAIVGRVLRSGAYSNVLLGRLGAGPDERLVRRLVYGTLRHLTRVDRLLEEASSRPLTAIEPGLLDILRVATWELRLGGGAPHAAVNEAVNAVTDAHGKRAGGFANAVLRAVQRGDERLPAGLEGRALELGAAPWMVERLAAAWGAHEADAFFAASLEPAAPTVRRRPGADLAGEPIAGIRDAFQATPGSEGLVPMDPSSVAVGWAAAPEGGMTVLDMAAAPGGKTIHLYDQMAGEGVLVAADRHPRRIESARRRLQAEGVVVPWVVADGAQAPFAVGTFDRVLLDAPCTGLGALRRRPEIRHRLVESSAAGAGALQQRLLDAALALVTPGGYVVYAVCTVFPEETTDIVAGRRAEPPTGLPGRPAGNGWLLGPHLTGSDGMFISLVRP